MRIKKNSKWHVVYRVHFSTSVSACYAHFDAVLRIWRPSLKILWMVSFSVPVTQAVLIPFCTTLDLQLTFYRPLCYNSRAHCPLLQCLRATSAICICFDRVIITAQCTAAFSDLLCSPKCRYYQGVNIPIKCCSEAYFFRLEVL